MVLIGNLWLLFGLIISAIFYWVAFYFFKYPVVPLKS